MPRPPRKVNNILERAAEEAENFFGQKITAPVNGTEMIPRLTDHPVEHVTWENAPPAGHYTVQVNPYAMPYSALSPYRVSIFYNGKELISRTGTAAAGHTIQTTPVETTIAEFNIPG
ncbi:hypothetical protein [Komagataeibacter sp. FNDCR2]|uniref:hypothetical protein n=1 Tax=Komagataeibacter sp. FNDCR2 TaxID=2878682 RepID=UPI001E60042D|nr:hypothetical protein [Komagataeibacter sp. FNDCR2]MCE2574126.1 hypothetical protein [Komagataeibacter sp. FNDCR2]